MKSSPSGLPGRNGTPPPSLLMRTPTWTSEGIYEGYSRFLRDRYVTGISLDRDKVLADLQTVKEGQRQEYNPELLDQVRLYISPVDGKLHLFRAAGGAWNLGASQRIEYDDLDQDGYINSWRLIDYSPWQYQGEQLQKGLVLAHGALIYWDDGQAEIRPTGLPASAGLVLPPTSHAGWQELGGQLKKYQLNSAPTDFQALAARSGGPGWRLSGGRLQDFRRTPGGYRFILELQPGYRVEGQGGPRLDGLPPGQYAVEYHGDYTVQPLTPPSISVAIQSPGRIGAFEQVPLQIEVANQGLEDGQPAILVVAARAPNTTEATDIYTRTVILLAGAPMRVVQDWQPMQSRRLGAVRPPAGRRRHADRQLANCPGGRSRRPGRARQCGVGNQRPDPAAVGGPAGHLRSAVRCGY